MSLCGLSKGKMEGREKGRNVERRKERGKKKKGIGISSTGCIFMAVNARTTITLPGYYMHRWKT